jgi:hypothetical protein
MPGGDSHRGKSLKLLEKIPEDAEATVVLVGEKGWVLGAGVYRVWCLHCGLLILSSDWGLFSVLLACFLSHFLPS